jgi:hypothetical protein
MTATLLLGAATLAFIFAECTDLPERLVAWRHSRWRHRKRAVHRAAVFASLLAGQPYTTSVLQMLMKRVISRKMAKELLTEWDGSKLRTWANTAKNSPIKGL